MFRALRRKERQGTKEDGERILKTAQYGVLAVAGDAGYPYAVPLNFVYLDGKIYFHCAKTGHKIDAIRRTDKVSFCAVANETIVPAEYTTHYESVIAFGRAKFVEDNAEREHIARLLAERYACGTPERTEEEVNQFSKALCVVEIAVEHLSAKINI